ncbi:MAG TPA: SpoIIIAH-like family protein [Mobilitalea sp.]|nr:SpoIIIAH-like family protein [Mobilitalea sp.]
MKNIFKKNQIIITALAVMIAIAGYLSFTNNDKPEDKKTIETTNPDLEDFDVLSELEGFELVQEIDDTTTDGTATDGTTDSTAADGTTDDTATDDTTDDTNAEAAAEDNDETTPVEITSESDELGDISDEDILATASEVTDSGELELEDGIPGEAVLASTTLEAGFFISNRLEREQMRARNRAIYKEVIESHDVSEASKKDAIASLIEITSIAEKENATEIALAARGFDGALVSINDGKVDVVINAESINDQQLAIIESEIKKKTDIAVADMTIVPVIVED